MGNAYGAKPSALGTKEIALSDLLVRYRDALEEALRQAIASSDGPLNHLLRYHLGWADEKGNTLTDSSSQGKALRPTLCLFLCEALGGDWGKSIPAAVALELVHNFSLIHDDIQDGDMERRHRSTVWSLWGKPKAIAAGSAMCTYAYMALDRLADHGFPVETCLEASNTLARRCLEMIEGQYLDLSYEDRLDIGVNDYLKMVSYKTGALMQCSTELGALLSGGSAEVVQTAARYGHSLGLAFQIRDDILGIWGDSATTGKATGNDIWRRKKSLPVVYALETASGTARRDINHIYSKPSVNGDDVERVLSILEEVEAKKHSQALAQAKATEALDASQQLDMTAWGRRGTEALVCFLVARTY